MKTYSSWNQQQFNEYLHKSNQYEKNNTFKCNSNSISDHKASFNIYDYKNSSSINKQQEIDNFYSLPGESLSDEITLDYRVDKDDKVLFPESDLYKIRTKSNTYSSLEPLKLANNTINVNNPNLFLNDTLKLDNDLAHHGDGCTNLISPTASFGSLQRAYIQASYNLKSYLESTQMMKSDISTLLKNLGGENVTRVDKYVQTSDSTSNTIINNKTLDKSNQTNNIKVKHYAVSTDSLMLQNNNYERSVINSKDTKIECENKTDINNLKLKNSEILTEIYPNTTGPVVSGSKLKVSENKTATLSKECVTFDQLHLDSENENENGNDSNLDEFTMISKSNSKFASFNEILGNLGLHLQNSEESFKNVSLSRSNLPEDKDNNLSSFWDNPLDQLELTKSEPQANVDKTLFPDFGDSAGDNIKQSLREVYESLGTGKDKPIDNQKPLTQDEDRTGLKTAIRLEDQLRPNPFGMENKPQSKSYGYRYASSRKSNFINSGMKFTKSFYLSPYDDLVKSHFNPSDRRIKSVSSKNGSSILIEGPINTYDNYTVSPQSKSKVIYRCTIASFHQESLDKCINYLKETFPNTYLRNGIKSVLK